VRSDTKKHGVALAASGMDEFQSAAGGGGSRDSFSGHERDHFFANLGGERFIDLGGIYGLDHPGDGRTIAILDYDHDGWMDFAVASSNEPSLQIYRNRIGEVARKQGHFIALRLEGGSRVAVPSHDLSPREGYGARIEVETASGVQALESRCGEGRSATQSRTLIVGLGEEDVARRVSVRWPSGRESVVEGVESGTLLTVYEVAEHSSNGSGSQRTPYERVDARVRASHGPALAIGAAADELRVLVTMSTGCAACLRAKPSLERLKTECGDAGVGFYGIPVDASDDAEALQAYIEQRHPPYEVLSGLSEEEVDAVRAIVRAELGYESTPSTIVTDRSGRVLDVRAGVPSLSVLKRCLALGGRDQ
jgi:thiol-disulfide isomerase/thioredoxin